MLIIIKTHFVNSLLNSVLVCTVILGTRVLYIIRVCIVPTGVKMWLLIHGDLQIYLLYVIIWAWQAWQQRAQC